VGGEAGPIPHVFSGCYRADALRGVQGWDVRFHANEDFEADTRIREGGGVLWLAPNARSIWFVRETPRALAIQMWRYGYYKALTLKLHPESLKARQLAPPALVAGLVAGSVLRPRATALAAAGYAVASASLGASAARKDGASVLRGAVVPAVVHLSWGGGLLSGMINFGLRSTHAEAPEGQS
jgi:hypothetical protein